MIRVTRYDENGKVFHTCLTEGPLEMGTFQTGITLTMPLRHWHMLKGGRMEIFYAHK